MTSKNAEENATIRPNTSLKGFEIQYQTYLITGGARRAELLYQKIEKEICRLDHDKEAATLLPKSLNNCKN